MATATRTKKKERELPGGAVEINGYVILEPEARPSDKQLQTIVSMLRENRDVQAPRMPRTKLDASKAITALKKKI